MKIAGQLMLPDGEGAVRLSPGVVRVEGEAIVEVVEGELDHEALADVDYGGAGVVVCPGLIDAHVHLPQFGIIGAHGLELLDWLSGVTFPAEMAWADAVYAENASRAAIEQLLRAGTTGFAAYATVHRDGALAALKMAEAIGVQAHIGQVLMDQNAPEALCRPGEAQLEEAAALLAQYPAGGRVSAAVTPRFAPTCSMELLEGAGELAADSGALVQTHLAETRAECAWVGELFGGRGYVEVYQDAGLVGPRSVFGHGIYLSDAERQALAEAGAVVAHCPTANSFLMSGRFDQAACADAGLGVALGSDLGAGYERSMVRVARAMLETAGALSIDRASQNATPRAESLPTAAQAWWQITAGNAAALGWDRVGELAAGMRADLLVIGPDSLGHTPEIAALIRGENHGVDALSALMFGWDDRWLRQVFVAGEARL